MDSSLNLTNTRTIYNTSLQSDINQVYASLPQAGFGISSVGTDLHVNVDNSTIEINGSDQLQVKKIGPSQLHLTQDYVFSSLQSTKVPVLANDVINKSALDSAVQGIVSGGTPAVSAGSGLSLSGSTLSVKVAGLNLGFDGSNNLILLDSSVGPSKMAMNSQFAFTNTTASTSATTGALTIAGGLGISGRLNVGGTETNLISTSSSSQRLFLQNNTNRIVHGVVVGDSAGDYHVYDLSNNRRILGYYNTNTLNLCNTTGVTQVLGTTASTSTSTGALLVAGGVGISGRLSASTISGTLITASQPNITQVGTLSSLTAGTINVTTEITVPEPTSSNHAVTKSYADALAVSASLNPSSILSLTNTTQSTDPSNGALVVSGGVGIGGNLFVGGGTMRLSSSLTQATLQIQHSSRIFNLNSVEGDSSGDLHLRDFTNARTVWGYYQATQRVNFPMTVDSTSVTTGCVTMAGGCGIAKNLKVGGSVALQSTTQSTSTSTGALVVSGGIGVAGNIHVGGEIRRSTNSVINLGPASNNIRGIYSTVVRLYTAGTPRSTFNEVTISYPASSGNNDSAITYSVECATRDDYVHVFTTSKQFSQHVARGIPYNQTGNFTSDVWLSVTVIHR